MSNTNAKIEYTKPDLVNPRIKEKIHGVLCPPKEDFWAPAVNQCQTFWSKFIRPNILVIVITIIIVVILVLRYRSTRQKKLMEKFRTPIYVQQPVVQYQQQHYEAMSKELKEMIMNEYNRQKEVSREPVSGPNGTPLNGRSAYSYGALG